MVVEQDPAATRAFDDVLARLDAFKRKFYLSLLVRGALVAGGLLLSLFLVFSLLEYFLYLPTWVRGAAVWVCGWHGLRFYALDLAATGGPYAPAAHAE